MEIFMIPHPCIMCAWKLQAELEKNLAKLDKLFESHTSLQVRGKTGKQLLQYLNHQTALKNASNRKSHVHVCTRCLYLALFNPCCMTT